MDKKELSLFLRTLINKTEEKAVEWHKLDLSDLTKVLRDIANYSSITGGFATINKKGNKETIIGKYKVKVYFEEDEYYYENYSFLAISQTGEYTSSIVFGENEFPISDIQNLEKLYRNVELMVNDVSSIMEDWF